MADKPWRNRELMHDLYVNEGLSGQEIAEKLDCGDSTVYAWLENHGIDTKSHSEAVSEYYENENASERQQAISIYESGESVKETAEEVGRPIQTVRTWLYNANAIRDNVDCPSCDKSFENKNGMKVHHAKAHDESISGVEKECENCGKEYRGRHRNWEDTNHDFCSQQCFGEWFSNNRSGENNPKYTHVQVECETCGDTKEIKKSQYENHDNHFCSEDCRAEWLSENPINEKNDENWVELVCEHCEEKFERPKWKEQKADRDFCDMDCYVEWSKEHMTGENSPRWNGGYGRYYGPSWQEQREKARERADYSCESCGATQEELGQIPDCHHIVRFHNFGVENHEEANELSNLMLLCRSCHQKWEHIPIRPQRIT